MVVLLGDPDHGVILASYVGSFLMAGASAIGSAAVRAVEGTSHGVCPVVHHLPPFVLAVTPRCSTPSHGRRRGSWTRCNFSFQSHFEQITRGVISARDIVFFLSVMALFLFANALIVEDRKAS
ncbi:MAG: hypothetical protein R3F49_02155 [Planctomycetota bacterium]